MHVGEIPRLRAEKAPHDPCVADERVRLTSGEFAAAVERLSGGFASLGIGAGESCAHFRRSETQRRFDCLTRRHNASLDGGSRRRRSRAGSQRPAACRMSSSIMRR